MRSVGSWFEYLLLLPLIGAFHLALLFLGGVELPFTVSLFGREIHEVESFTISGGKSLGNLAEVPIALCLGGLAAAALFLLRRKGYLLGGKAVRAYVAIAYGLSVLMYFLTPSLPE